MGKTNLQEKNEPDGKKTPKKKHFGKKIQKKHFRKTYFLK